MVIRGNDLFSVMINFRGLLCESAASQRGFSSSCCCSVKVDFHLQLKLSLYTVHCSCLGLCLSIRLSILDFTPSTLLTSDSVCTWSTFSWLWNLAVFSLFSLLCYVESSLAQHSSLTSFQGWFYITSCSVSPPTARICSTFVAWNLLLQVVDETFFFFFLNENVSSWNLGFSPHFPHPKRNCVISYHDKASVRPSGEAMRKNSFWKLELPHLLHHSLPPSRPSLLPFLKHYDNTS